MNAKIVIHATSSEYLVIIDVICRFTVFDYERFGGNKEIGSIIVPATDIPLYDKVEKWYTLNTDGDVHVEMWFYPRQEK